MRDEGLIILRNDESFWGQESALRVKTGRFFFCKFRDFEVVELSWMTYPEKIKFFFWDGLIVMGDLPGWKMQRFFRDFFKMVKNTEVFQSGLVVMGDLLRWKTQRFFKEVKNKKISQNGFIVMGNRPRWKMNRVFEEVWLWWVTCPSEIKLNKLKCFEEKTW